MKLTKSVTELYLPNNAALSITGDLSKQTNLTINFDGQQLEWNQLVEHNGNLKLPADVIVNCRVIVSDDLNLFVNADSTYFVQSGPEYPVTRPALIRNESDVLTMKLHFSEIPGSDTENEYQMRTPEGDTPAPLYYILPVEVTKRCCCQCRQ